MNIAESPVNSSFLKIARTLSTLRAYNTLLGEYMTIKVNESDRSSQRDSKTSLKQISEYLSLEEGQKIAQSRMKYFKSAKVEFVYYWIWAYETNDDFQMYAIVDRQREKQYSEPVYSIGSCSDNGNNNFDEMLIDYHIRNGHKSCDN